MIRLFCILFFFKNIIIFSQQNFENGIVEYGFRTLDSKIVKKLNSLKGKVSKEMFESLKQQLEKSQRFEDVTFYLKFDKNLSIFEYDDKMSTENNDLSLELRRVQVQANNKYNYIFIKKEIIKQTEFQDELFLIKKSSDSLKWKLINEKRKIGKYLCYKATTFIRRKFPSGIKKIPVIAWYTPDISIPIGPYQYNGLPGLIVELREGSNSLFVKKIKLSKTTIKIKKLKGKITTEEEFEKIWRQYIPRKN